MLAVGAGMASSSKPGLYANIHAKQERIAHGSGEKMRKPGSKGAPSEASFAESAQTAKDKTPAQKRVAKKKATRKTGARTTAKKVR